MEEKSFCQLGFSHNVCPLNRIQHEYSLLNRRCVVKMSKGYFGYVRKNLTVVHRHICFFKSYSHETEENKRETRVQRRGRPTEDWKKKEGLLECNGGNKYNCFWKIWFWIENIQYVTTYIVHWVMFLQIRIHLNRT